MDVLEENTGASPSELATMRLVRITSDSSTISGISAGATSAGSSHLLLDPAVVRSSGDRGAPTSPQITPKGGDKKMWDTDMDAGDAGGRGGAVGRKRAYCYLGSAFLLTP